MTLVPSIRRHSLELQFWGYETGNIVAAITGAGGIAALQRSIRTAREEADGPVAMVTRLFADFPEAAATLGVVFIVVVAFPLARAVRVLLGERCADAVNALAVPLALSLLVYAMIESSSPFTIAACTFVASSCLLRGAGHFPLLLKLGGLGLALGGIALAAAAFSMATGSAALLALAAVTFLSGLYVSGAGLLTYQGGCFAVADWLESAAPAPASPVSRLLHPGESRIAKTLTAHLDAPVRRISTGLVQPAIFWVGDEVKRTRPFLTSMMARLPWRLIAAALGVLSGTEVGYAFALANLLWAVGDIALGALDAPAQPVGKATAT